MVDISLAQLEANLRAALQMREAAEREARLVKETLIALANYFLAAEIDAVRQQGDDPGQWPASKLGEWIKEKLRARINRLEFAARASSPEVLQRTQAEIERLQAQIRELQARSGQLPGVEAELARAQETIRARDTELAALQTEVTRLREVLAREREAAPLIPAPVSPSSAGEKPEWFIQWQTSRGFESESAVVRVMGFQGFCLYQSIEDALLKAGTIGAGVLNRVLNRLQDQGLVERAIPKGESSKGRVPHLYWLTDQGCQAFRLLYEQEPVESEYYRLKARHKGDEHIVLNLQARDVFEARGATVNLYPQRVVIQGELYHDPDLVVIFPGQDKPLYVECERGTSRLGSRDDKWENYATVTTDFYFVVPNNSAQSGILSEVTEWVLRTQQSPITIHICNLSAQTEQSSLWNNGFFSSRGFFSS